MTRKSEMFECIGALTPEYDREYQQAFYPKVEDPFPCQGPPTINRMELEKQFKLRFNKYGRASVHLCESRDEIEFQVRFQSAKGEYNVLERISGMELMHGDTYGLVLRIFDKIELMIKRELTKQLEALIGEVPKPFFLVPKGAARELAEKMKIVPGQIIPAFHGTPIYEDPQCEPGEGYYVPKVDDPDD